MGLTIEPDWPTGETLRITAEINGLENISPELGLTVSLPTSLESY